MLPQYIGKGIYIMIQIIAKIDEIFCYILNMS
jgi:hypothetical protein